MPHDPRSVDALSRRRFLALAGAVPALALAPSLLRGAPATANSTSNQPVKTSSRKIPIGLELYSVRGELARDLPGTLRRVSKIGYEAVEFYAPYFDWTPAYAREVRSQMNDLGLRCLSTHNHIASFTPGEGMAKAIELNHIIGARQVVMSMAPKGTDTAEDWKKLCGQLSAATEKFLPEGLTAGYHNHQAEWASLPDGGMVMDILATDTPEQFVLQLDVGTCMEAGHDPVAWIEAHPGRIRSVHLKDWAPGSEADQKGYRVLFGEGISPWARIVEAAEKVGGVEVYLMEQEGSRYSEFETAERCLESWKKLRGTA